MSGAPAAVLRIASWLVPGDQRAEWLAEWRSELYYVPGNGPSLRFCFGAIPDALWMCRNTTGSRILPRIRLNSPVHCLLFLAAFAALSALLAFRIPAARDLFLPYPYPQPQDLVMMMDAAHCRDRGPTLTMADYRILAMQENVAFYRPAKARVSTGQRTARLSVAFASANLFDLLGKPVSAPALVVNESAWKAHFENASPIAGRVVEVDGQKVTVAAVVPSDFWRLPGKADAWLLEKEASLPADTRVFILGRGGARHRLWRWDLTVPKGDGDHHRFEVAKLDHEQPVWITAAILGFATLTFPMLICWQRGDYPHGAAQLRWWTFLFVKTALLLPAVCFTTFVMASATVSDLQPHGLLIGFFFALRWVLADQRRRCPECLRLLTNPVRIGRPSQTFLEGWGTELMCGEGHGLLLVPEIPSSSSSTQSWLTLEQSWNSLYSRAR